MRYNIKLFWNYIIYILMALFGFLIPLSFHGFNLTGTFITDIKANLTFIWLILTIMFFVFFIFSIKNETKWKKTNILDYLVSLTFSMFQGALLLMSFTMISTIPLNSGDVLIGSWIQGIILYFVLSFITGIFFIVFASALWFKSTGDKTKESNNILFAIKKSFSIFIKGWTFFTSVNINEDIGNFNLMITPKNSYHVEILSSKNSLKIELGGKEKNIDKDDKETIKNIEASELIISFEKKTKLIEKYLNSFYKDPQNEESKIDLIPVLVYPFDKEIKPIILGDVKDKLIISDKEFIKQISSTEYRKSRETYLIKSQITKQIDSDRI